MRYMNARKIAEDVEQYFCQVGVPEEILTDQDRNLDSSNFAAKSLLEA